MISLETVEKRPCIPSLGWHETAPEDLAEFSPEDVFATGLRNHHIANTAYPIRHGQTMREYRILPEEEKQRIVVDAWRNCSEMSLYVHIPFCKSRCRYCEYVVVEPQEAEKHEDEYFEHLFREIEMYRQKIGTQNKRLVGFDIGGGTPSFAKSENIARLVYLVRESFEVKPGLVISVETTPIIAATEPEKIQAFRNMGIERISMGLQTTQATLAKAMDREFPGIRIMEEAVRNIREAGFDRLNIDLMYGFADQSVDGWRATVRETINLGPEYITLYRVRHKGTKIEEQAAMVTLDDVKRLERVVWQMLMGVGYQGSVGKNTYSLIPGDAGTSDYLTERVIKGTPYLGVGLGAQTFSPYTLSYNLGAATKTLSAYFGAIGEGRLPVQDIYHLSPEAAMAKMISVSFYFGQIHLGYFEEKFGISLKDKFSREVEFLLSRGYMQEAGPFLRLTPEGNKYYNGIIALFYAGAVKKYLIDLG